MNKELEECYNRNIKYLEKTIQENKEKEEAIRKILDLMSLEWVWKDILERRLYAWAMKDHNFAKAALKYK